MVQTCYLKKAFNSYIARRCLMVGAYSFRFVPIAMGSPYHIITKQSGYK